MDRWFFWGFCFFFCAACTQVKLYTNGQIDTRYYPGVAVVRVEPTSESLIAIDTTGVGLAFSPVYTYLGYVNESIVLADPRQCSMVLFVEKVQQIAAIQAVLNKSGVSLDQVCLSHKGNGK